ncbi:hypothetical protein EDB87DRAFT_680714 [Lactarius vividus]|nr:hypothetical protein EDB87DRAFT_680714 [Lactarius vividus]
MHSLKLAQFKLPWFFHYKQTPEFPPSTAQNECLKRVSIGGLSDRVLLKIFCHYLDDSESLFWPRLAHICCRWRRIIFAHFRLHFTHGTPVSKALVSRPALPIVMEYGGSLALDPPAPEDEGDIMTALKQSDRVVSISLTVTSSLLEKLSAIERPFSELEDLVLLSRDGVQLTLPSAFRWGPRLRYLSSTRVAFPALLRLLYSSTNIVDLHLHEILYPSYLTPEVLTDALSGMTQLRSLSLHFLSTAIYPSSLPPAEECVVLPALTRFDFRGLSKYLDGLMAIIDAPRLGDIGITFLDNPVFGDSKLNRFVDRIVMHKSHRQAHILSSQHAISVSLIRPGAPTCLQLRFLSEPLGMQLTLMTQVCICLSTFIFNVEDLHISATRQPSWEGGLFNGQWLELINPFTGIKQLQVSGNLSTHIVRALQQRHTRREIVLPALKKLYIPQPWPRHASLREAVVSFMISHRLSGNRIPVEYERLYQTNESLETGPLFQQVTIETLSDDILFDLFRHCLGPIPQIWPTLAGVCQRWRQIVLTSPRGLNLRLYCTYGTPALKTLDPWPTLPIAVKYGGFPKLDPPLLKDEDNIVVALKHSGRVSSINLTVTSSLLEKLRVISEPLSELEELVLLSQDNMQLTLPNTFRWGTRLRTLHSTRIALLSFPQLLSPCKDLIDLQLHEISSDESYPPATFANALSGMTQLRTLSLHFLSSSPPINHLVVPPPSPEHVVLPALRCFKYRGTSKYLDNLVARIDAPGLGDIDVTFFIQPMMDASELGRFIERTEIHTSLSQADVQTFAHAISISFTSSSSPIPLQLQVSCTQLDQQLSSMAQVCDRLSPFLSRIETLSINTTQSPSEQNDVEGEQWLELVRSFGGAKDFRVAGIHMKDILCALCPAGAADINVLTALRSLRVRAVAFSGPLGDAIRSFVTSRRRLGRPVKSELLCFVCDYSSRYPQSLRGHLVDEHAYRFLCSYCSNFECTQEHNSNDLFQEHLKSKHPRVARNDPLISRPFLGIFGLGRLVDQHSSPRAPVSRVSPR